MDWKTFAVSIIDSIAWPVSIIVLIFLLRKPIKILVEDRLDSLTYKDVSLKFRKGVDKLEKISPPSTPKEVKSAIKKTSIPFSEIAKESPELSILYVWKTIEDKLIQKSQSLNLTRFLDDDSFTPSRVMAFLAEISTIDTDAYRIYHELQNLRNVAAHRKEKLLSYNDTISFINYAEVLMDMIDKAELQYPLGKNKQPIKIK